LNKANETLVFYLKTKPVREKLKKKTETKEQKATDKIEINTSIFD
jgi:hypothetical protein